MRSTLALLAFLSLSPGCAAKKQLGEAQSRAATCESELAQSRTHASELKGKLDEAKLALELADKRLAAYKDLAARLRDAYGSDLAIEIRNGRMVVKLPNAILFDTGKSELKPDGKQALTKLAKVLQAEKRNFQIAGHTDNQAVTAKATSYKTNFELSAQRALSTVYFLQGVGMKPEHLAAVGYGEYQPLVANDTPDHMAQNRRTEIVIMPKLDEMPAFPKDL